MSRKTWFTTFAVAGLFAGLAAASTPPSTDHLSAIAPQIFTADSPKVENSPVIFNAIDHVYGFGQYAIDKVEI